MKEKLQRVFLFSPLKNLGRSCASPVPPPLISIVRIFHKAFQLSLPDVQYCKHGSSLAGASLNERQFCNCFKISKMLSSPQKICSASTIYFSILSYVQIEFAPLFLYQTFKHTHSSFFFYYIYVGFFPFSCFFLFFFDKFVKFDVKNSMLLK